MPTPEELERAAKAISALLRGAQNKTLRPKDVNHLGPEVVAGITFLETGARNMRAKQGS
ncbi:hypothetical protein V5F34_00940 [Xanthobacter autotrophicus]|uniref:hypothetical protein n=1 Tax=Xanthobacter autotrophicus TaxID=280 RepID=UPI00372A9A09